MPTLMPTRMPDGAFRLTSVPDFGNACQLIQFNATAAIVFCDHFFSDTSPVYPIGGTLAKCDPFGTPSTSHWTGAAIIVQSPRTKTCIVTRSRTSTRPMLFSLAG